VLDRNYVTSDFNLGAPSRVLFAYTLAIECQRAWPRHARCRHPMSAASSNEVDRSKQLMALMTRHQRQIFAYIYTLGARPARRGDLLQETSLVSGEKFDDFTPGSDFVAWAARSRGGASAIPGRNCAVESDLRDEVPRGGRADRRRDGARTRRSVTRTLAGCLKKLPSRDGASSCSRATSPAAASPRRRSLGPVDGRRLQGAQPPAGNFCTLA